MTYSGSGPADSITSAEVYFRENASSSFGWLRYRAQAMDGTGMPSVMVTKRVRRPDRQAKVTMPLQNC
jgi:hypothetical protein